MIRRMTPSYSGTAAWTDSVRYLVPLVGLLFVICSLRALFQVRTRGAVIFTLSNAAGAIGVSVWQTENAALIDSSTHLPGFARLLSDLLFTASALLQFIFAAGLIPSWRVPGRKVLAGFLGAALALCLVWALVPVSGAHLIATTVRGRPLSVLAYNLVAGLSVACAYGMCAIAYVYVVRHTTYHRTRVTLYGALPVVALCALYGLLVVLEALADRAGIDTFALQQDTHLLVSANAIAATIVVALGVVLWPIWRNLRTKRFQRQQQELWRLRRDLLDATVLLSDRLAKAYRFVNKQMVHTAGRWCKQQALPTDQARVTVEAARWLSLEQANLTSQQPDAPDEDPGAVLVSDLAWSAESDTCFYSDMLRVLLLALGPENVPEEIERRSEPAGWRREVAGLLVALALSRKETVSA